MHNAELLIRDPEPIDEAAWRLLWDGYCTFYKAAVPAATTDATWARLLDPPSGMRARLAWCGGQAIGFAIVVLHPSTWEIQPTCYLEDLFVDSSQRGGGVGRALIDDLIALSKANGWSRLYWHTQSGNATARRLYDRFVAADDFVRYRMVF